VNLLRYLIRYQSYGFVGHVNDYTYDDKYAIQMSCDIDDPITLADLVVKRNGLDDACARAIFRNVVIPTLSLWRLNIVHRNLIGDNVLVAECRQLLTCLVNYERCVQIDHYVQHAHLNRQWAFVDTDADNVEQLGRLLYA